jgi:hypothetical protein
VTKTSSGRSRDRAVRVVGDQGAPRSSTSNSQPPSTLPIGSRDQALLVPELKALVAGLTDPAAREGYAELLKAVELGHVHDGTLERLGAFLELSLSTGRARSQLGPHAEESLRRLYERTPRGAAQAGSASEVTKALEGLVGQTLRDLKLTLVRPGTYRLYLETDGYRVDVGLAPAGAHVQSVEVML